ncbi:hypothetical protein M2421_001436 [Stenotrophomonas sp. BIGb0135]|nr:hypothetical protein [Stenotrophomonas sp. BIGb0135]
MSWARCRTPARPTPDPVEPTVGRPSAVRGVLVPERNAADQRSALRAKCASRATSDPRSNPHPMRPDPDAIPIRSRSDPDPTPIRPRSAIGTRVEPTVGRLRAARGFSVSGWDAADQRSALRARCASRATSDPHPICLRSASDPASDPAPDPNPGRADRWSAARGVWLLGIGAECSRPTVRSTREMRVPSHTRSASDPRTIRTRSASDPRTIRTRSASGPHPMRTRSASRSASRSEPG